MQYSYERWLPNTSEATESPQATLEPPVVAPTQPIELKKLEQTIPLNLEDGMQAYRQHQGGPQAGLWREESASGGEADQWDGLAKLVADHVLAYMLDNPLQNQLDELRLKNDEYYRDNRAMAEQVRKLVEENEHLRHSLSKAEKELAHFQKLGGSFYLKH